jgi:UDP-GlcNAc:undecaprenyl-phosphate GlcNAc-1-phosphate transferase
MESPLSSRIFFSYQNRCFPVFWYLSVGKGYPLNPFIIAGFVLPAAAFGLCAALTACVRRWAIRTDFVARPREDRYHRTVIALGGGIAIFWTLILLLLGGILLVQFGLLPNRWMGPDARLYIEGFLSKRNHLLIVMGCALVLHLMGLWDDKKRIGPLFKLIVQFLVAAVAAAVADIRVEFFIPSKIITTGLSVFWIVLIMNAFNFLDNMDGASAGIAAIATAVLLTAALRSGQVFVGGMALIFLGTLLGFLVFNFPPAKIFMGDAGSLVVGFFVAVLTLRTTYYDPARDFPLTSVFMPLIVMAVPLYDFTSVTFLRIKQGKSPFVGDTQHFSHRLRRRGLSDVQVALTLYLATLCTGIGAVALQKVDRIGAVLIFVQTLMVLGIIAILESTGKNDSKNLQAQ